MEPTPPQAPNPADEATQLDTLRKPYAPPRLTQHGKLMRLTAVVGSGLDSDESDRGLKEGFEAVAPRTILARLLTLPIERWSYKGEPARHLGPMAQDFTAAFGLGADDRHIFPLDAAGVALAAIQGLYDLVQAQSARLEALEREVAAHSVMLPGRESVEVA